MASQLEPTEAQAIQLLVQGFQPRHEPAPIELDEPVGCRPVPRGLQQHFQTSVLPQDKETQQNNGAAVPNTRERLSPGITAPSRGRSLRGGVASSNNFSQHPVVALGFQPKCSVICNGLKGEFLGGHDRDMFIRCTSSEYTNLPLVDVSQGGCIMTCSQFERAAGRELSKKWKESIHVVGEGEGSRATLISWIKRAAEREYGPAIVGRQVWVCWCADADFYQGTITAFNSDTGKHTVQYSPKMAEDLHLPVELISFDPVKPSFPPPDGSHSLLKKATTAPEMLLRDSAGCCHHRLHQQGDLGILPGTGTITTTVIAEDASPVATITTPIAHLQAGTGAGAGNLPIWHQGSGTSANSSFYDDFGPVSPKAVAPPIPKAARSKTSRKPRPIGVTGRPAILSTTKQQDVDTGLGEPYPKRTCSAPANVLLAAVAAAEEAEQQQQQQQRQRQAEQSKVQLTPVLPVLRAAAAPITMAATTTTTTFKPASYAIAKQIAEQPPPQVQPQLLPSPHPVLTPSTLLPPPVGVSAPTLTLTHTPAINNNNKNTMPGLGSMQGIIETRNAASGALPHDGRSIKQEQHQQQSTFYQQQQTSGINTMLSVGQSLVPPPPPGNGHFACAGLEAATRWMHTVALSLDQELQSYETQMTSGVCSTPRIGTPTLSGGSGNGNNNNNYNGGATIGNFPMLPTSVSSRFQTLIALGRKEPKWVEGLFEAMAFRYIFYTNNNVAVLPQKMVEFMVAALHETAVQHDMVAAIDLAAKDNNNNNGPTAMTVE